HVLSDRELHSATQRRLDRGLVHLPVALRAVAVADLEERARNENRNIERAASDQLPVVQITGMLPGRVAADAPKVWRRSHSHAAEERPERNDDARLELRGHRLGIELQDRLENRWIAVRRNEATAAVVAVVDRKIDRQDLHLEHVAWFGALHVHRPCQDMGAWSATVAQHLSDNSPQRLLNLFRRHTRPLQACRAVCE